jgi:hypothetical protein
MPAEPAEGGFQSSAYSLRPYKARTRDRHARASQPSPLRLVGVLYSDEQNVLFGHRVEAGYGLRRRPPAVFDGGGKYYPSRKPLVVVSGVLNSGGRRTRRPPSPPSRARRSYPAWCCSHQRALAGSRRTPRHPGPARSARTRPRPRPKRPRRLPSLRLQAKFVTVAPQHFE